MVKMKPKVAFVVFNERVKSVVNNCMKSIDFEYVVYVGEESYLINTFEYDLVCILGDNDESILESLMHLSDDYESYRKVVFTNNLKKEIILRYLRNGADGVCLLDEEVIVAQLRVVKARFNYYSAPVRIDDFVFDPAYQTISNGKESVQLNPTETRLLRLLAHRRGELVKYDELAFYMNDGVESSSKDYTKVYVHRLRKLLERVHCPYVKIVNHYNVGYSLVVDQL